MGSENIIILVLVVAVVAIGIWSTVRHFRGKGGGCCGGGDYKPRKKKLSHVAGQKTFQVEGMHCEHCKVRVEEAVNDIKGAAGKVDLKKGLLTVSYTESLDDEQVKRKVESGLPPDRHVVIPKGAHVPFLPLSFALAGSKNAAAHSFQEQQTPVPGTLWPGTGVCSLGKPARLLSPGRRPAGRDVGQRLTGLSPPVSPPVWAAWTPEWRALPASAETACAPLRWNSRPGSRLQR